jgi:hypothetical protein
MRASSISRVMMTLSGCEQILLIAMTLFSIDVRGE